MLSPEETKAISDEILRILYTEKMNNQQDELRLRDIAAKVGKDFPTVTTIADRLNDEGFLKYVSLTPIDVEITPKGIKRVEHSREDFVPEFYRKPIPRGKIAKKEFLKGLYARLSESEAGSRDYVLTKEKIDQVRYADLDRANLKSLIAILVSIVSVGVAIASLILNRVK